MSLRKRNGKDSFFFIKSKIEKQNLWIVNVELIVWNWNVLLILFIDFDNNNNNYIIHYFGLFREKWWNKIF